MTGCFLVYSEHTYLISSGSCRGSYKLAHGEIQLNRTRTYAPDTVRSAASRIPPGYSALSLAALVGGLEVPSLQLAHMLRPGDRSHAG